MFKIGLTCCQILNINKHHHKIVVLTVYTNLLSINFQFCSAYEQSEIPELNISRKTADIKWLKATCGAAALSHSVNKPSRDSRDTFHESGAFRESASGEFRQVWQ